MINYEEPLVKGQSRLFYIPTYLIGILFAKHQLLLVSILTENGIREGQGKTFSSKIIDNGDVVFDIGANIGCKADSILNRLMSPFFSFFLKVEK